MKSSNELSGPSSQGDKPVPPSRTSRGLSNLAKVALAVGLVLLIGIGLFSAWQIGKSSATTTGATTLSRSGSSGANVSTQREAVAAQFQPSVVEISVVTQKGSGLGSGTIIDSRGYIVTNYHVIEGAKQIQVKLFDGMLLPAHLTGTDPPDDLAVIKITPPKNMAVATIGDSAQLAVGEDVVAIGNPLGITQTVTSGIVSALGRNVSEGPGVVIVDAVQTDAAINPGNSGGALVDLKGELIGVPTLTVISPQFNAPASGVGFAIPSDRVKFIVPQLIESGKVVHSGRADAGMQTITVDAEIARQLELAVDQGALIVSLVATGPAAMAGLRQGDVVVQVGNKAVTSASSLDDALYDYEPGQTVSMQVYRGSQKLTVKVTLGELKFA
jgi:S1-C subfamily serine protease